MAQKAKEQTQEEINMTDKTKQPHSEECETVVIGSCLLSEDGSVYDKVSQLLVSTDFFSAKNRIIFEALKALVSAGADVSEITLLEKLRDLKKEDYIGGIAYIYAILDQVETTSQAMYAAKIVKEKSNLRSIIRYARIAEETALLSEESSDDISAKLETELQSLQDEEEVDGNNIAVGATELEGDLASMLAGTYEKKGLRFGIPSIDEKLSDGLVGGTVTVIAAPSSCGKSQSALNCVLKNSIQDGVPCGIFSYEMPTVQLTKRMLQTSSGVNLARFRDQVANSNDQKKVKEAIVKLKASTILTNSDKRTADQMCSLARQWKRKYGIKILVIDYLQLMDSANNKLSSVESISYNSKRIKGLSLELDIPILVLSQVNREAVKRLAFTPEAGLHMHDLIGSSAIEADSDNILLFWPTKGEPAESRELDVNGRPYMCLSGQFAKYREGERGIRFKMKLIESLGRFS